MCNPLAIVGAGLQIGGAIAGHSAQNKANKANTQASLADLRLQYSDVNQRQTEESKDAANQIVAGLKQKDETQGTALAAAAGAGVGGISVQALLNTIEGDAASYTDSINENRDLKLAQLQREKSGVAGQAAGRIASVPKGSILGTGLRIAGSAFGAYAGVKANQPNNPKTPAKAT